MPRVRSITVLASLASLALVTLGAATAQAQYAPPPPPPGPPPPAYAVAAPVGPERSGLMLGFSLGGGSFNCDDCSDEDALSGLGLSLHIGGMITPTVALMFDGFGVSHAVDGGQIIHVIDTAAVQLFVTPRLWLKGGLGIGQLSISDEDGNTVAESDTGAAFLLAAGLELYQGRSFTLDAQVRAAAASYEHGGISMGTLTIGFNWY